MKRKITLKIFSAILAFTLTVTIFAFTLNAAALSDTYVKTAEEKPDFNYVALGASNVVGYGLHGYNFEEVYEAPFEKANGNRYGYKMDTPGTYAMLIKEKLSDNYNVNLSLIAMSSMRAEEVRFLLDENYWGDSYTDTWLYDTNGDGRSSNWSYGAALYEWEKRADAGVAGYDHTPTAEELLATLRDATVASVTEADLITIDVGMNNFGTYMLNLLAGGIFSNDLNTINPEIDKYYEEARNYVIGIVKNVMGNETLPEEMLNRFADTLAYALVGYCLNVDAVMERIYTLNPDVDVVVVTIQNMMRDLNIVFPGYEGTIPFGEIFGLIVNAANLYTAVLSPYSDDYYYTNVSADGHTEFFLDEIAAYNGDPLTLSSDMKDCFDVYDDNMFLKTRVQQMFAVHMSQSGFVNIHESQMDMSGTAGLKAFHYGFHYDVGDNNEPLITVADGTPLKDFIRKGEEGKLDGEARSAYEIYERMLNVAYDVIAEIMREAALADTIDLPVVFSSAGLGVSATGLTYDILNSAISDAIADSDYSFDVNELYPDGFFNAMAVEYGLSEGVFDTLFSYAIRIQFAGTAFSHPNANGYKEIFDNIWTSYTKHIKGKDIIADQLGIHYMPTENSHYVAVSSGNAGYAELFADSIGLTKDQLGYVNWDNIDYSEIDKADLVSIDFSENEMLGFAVDQVLAYVENYVSTDVRAALTNYVTSVIDGIPYLSALGFKDIAKNKVNSTLDDVLDNELFAGKTMVELDWSKLLNEDMLPIVELVRGEIKKSVISSIGSADYTVSIDVVEWLSRNADSFDTNPVASKILKKTSLLYRLFGDKAVFSIDLPIADGIVYAMESYLYSYVEYMLKSNALISYINSNHPDTKIIIFGHFNPMKGTYLEFGDTMINVGELVEVVALTSSVRSLMQYSMSSNSAFVHIIDAESSYKAALDAGEMDADLFTFVTLYLKDRSIVDVSPESNQYIVDQMLRYVTLDCDEHEYDSCDDVICNRCGDERVPISHVTGGCEDTVCDLCGKTVNAVGHSFGEWAVTKESGVDTEGEESRVCSLCGYTETRKLPTFDNDNNDAAIVSIIIACVAAAGSAGFCCYWFIIRKKIMSTAVKNKSDN